MGMIIDPSRFAVGGGGGGGPVYVSTGAHATNSLVANYPSSIQSGDLLLAAVAASAAAGIDYSPPAGFTRLTQVAAHSASANTAILALFYRIADGTETGTTTFTKNSASVNRQTATISRFTGATTFESIVASACRDSSTQTLASGSVTTTDTNRLIVNLFATCDLVSIAPESGWVEEFEYSDVFSGNIYSLALHDKTSSGTGAQAAEQPTPSGASTWASVSIALCSSGSIPTPSIAVRGSRLTHVNNASSLVFSLPAGSQAGDHCVIFASSGWAVNTPSGWTNRDTSNGANINGAVFGKLLTTADIAAGTVTITFAGVFYGSVGGVTFVGCTGGFRTITAQRNSTGGSPRTVTTDTTPVAGDYAIYFGSTRGSSTCASSAGSSLQTLNATSASACLFGGVLGSSGAASSNFTYSPTGSGDYQAIYVIRPV